MAKHPWRGSSPPSSGAGASEMKLPGFRFHPTEELLEFYLKQVAHGLQHIHGHAQILHLWHQCATLGSSTSMATLAIDTRVRCPSPAPRRGGRAAPAPCRSPPPGSSPPPLRLPVETAAPAGDLPGRFRAGLACCTHPLLAVVDEVTMGRRCRRNGR
ncbi:unnamed protein product [Miscanthus lutarioriparius]|uniref:NAC domain-containing protein n=1 Tax=Miscanthus lutarioriparius TaxID=422564 RepID=A0A811NEV4_9POAL|nr:unnamed protein product [Miscanthus lutarioriparius]